MSSKDNEASVQAKCPECGSPDRKTYGRLAGDPLDFSRHDNWCTDTSGWHSSQPKAQLTPQDAASLAEPKKYCTRCHAPLTLWHGRLVSDTPNGPKTVCHPQFGDYLHTTEINEFQFTPPRYDAVAADGFAKLDSMSSGEIEYGMCDLERALHTENEFVTHKCSNWKALRSMPREETGTRALAEAIEKNGNPCLRCGAGMCTHGICDNYCNNGDEPCGECFRALNQEADAKDEAEFQRNVMAPNFEPAAEVRRDELAQHLKKPHFKGAPYVAGQWPDEATVMVSRKWYEELKEMAARASGTGQDGLYDLPTSIRNHLFSHLTRMEADHVWRMVEPAIRNHEELSGDALGVDAADRTPAQPKYEYKICAHNPAAIGDACLKCYPEGGPATINAEPPKEK